MVCCRSEHLEAPRCPRDQLTRGIATYMKPPMNRVLLCLLAVTLGGCLHVTTDPIRVEPIYIEITVNHRVQEELDDIFAEIDQASTTTSYEPLEETSR